MLLLTCLLLAHFIADFYLQPHAWVMDKVQHREKSFGLFKHICVHVGLTLLVIVLCVGTLDWFVWVGFGLIIASHYAIDIWKTYQTFQIKYFLIDQVSHYLVIIGVSLWWLSSADLVLRSPTWWFEASTWLAILTGILGLVFLYKPVALTQILVLDALKLDNNPNYQFDMQSVLRRCLTFLFSITLTAMFVIIDILIRVLESYFEYRKSQDIKLFRKQLTIIVYNSFCTSLALIYIVVLTGSSYF